ncbi:hypothetical protein [Sulfitobacter sp. MF3-043]|uniref:hypothetical protein n=1 Tax=Sulfitobacter sediminivivens TaxID=3252902 RepID=UPI0036D79611
MTRRKLAGNGRFDDIGYGAEKFLPQMRADAAKAKYENPRSVLSRRAVFGNTWIARAQRMAGSVKLHCGAI